MAYDETYNFWSLTFKECTTRFYYMTVSYVYIGYNLLGYIQWDVWCI